MRKDYNSQVFIAKSLQELLIIVNFPVWRTNDHRVDRSASEGNVLVSVLCTCVEGGRFFPGSTDLIIIVLLLIMMTEFRGPSAISMN